MRHDTFIHFDPSGRRHILRVPTLWGPFDLARKLPHSLLFLRVPRGRVAVTRDLGQVAGPCVVQVEADELWYGDGVEPVSDVQAMGRWRALPDDARRR